MKRFRNILFADFGATAQISAAVSEAKRLAADNGADLTLYSVVPEPPPLQRILRIAGHAQPVCEIVAENLRDRLAEIAETLDYPSVEVAVAVGSPPLEVVRRVVEANHDLVVVTTSSESSAATIRRIMRLCPCPVWVLRPNFTGARVLAAVDPDDDPGLNQLILELASAQADRYSGDLHVVHAWEPYGHAAFLTDEYTLGSPQLLVALVDEAEARHRRAFDATVAAAGVGTPIQCHLVDGSPHRAITDLIRRFRIDLLVMGSAGRSGSDLLSIGNTAEQILKDVSCSVLVLKPPGFVTPIEPSRLHSEAR